MSPALNLVYSLFLWQINNNLLTYLAPKIVNHCLVKFITILYFNVKFDFPITIKIYSTYLFSGINLQRNI